MKLTAISSREEEDWRLEEPLGKFLCWSSWALQQCRRQRDEFGGCRMTGWGKSAKEGSIYRIK